MELNREQIIKALECCTLGDCYPCPYGGIGVGCRDEMCGDALALIKKLEIDIEVFASELSRYQELCKALAGENEILKVATNEQYSHLCDVHDKLAEMLRQKKSDTVREFAVRLIKHFDKAEAFTEMETDFLALEIEQIAKEMLEGEYAKSDR